MSTQAQGGWDTAVEVQNDTPISSPGSAATPQDESNILVDPSERIVAVIGTNYFQNFMTGGTVEKSVGILTPKRFYYKGQNLGGTGKAMKHTTEEGVVSIEDITFTMFSHTEDFGSLAAGVILALVGLCAMFMGMIGVMVGSAAMVVCVPFFIKFFVTRQTLFQVSFPGGGFGFDVKYYPIADIRDFQRQLHLLKDHYKEGEDI